MNNYNVIESPKDNILLILFPKNTVIEEAYIKDNIIYVNNKKLDMNNKLKKLIEKYDNIYLSSDENDTIFLLKFDKRELKKKFNKTKLKKKINH